VRSTPAFRCLGCGHDRAEHRAVHCAGGSGCLCTVTLNMLDYVALRRGQQLAFTADELRGPTGVSRRVGRGAVHAKRVAPAT
jgi:hypothetical protein